MMKSATLEADRSDIPTVTGQSLAAQLRAYVELTKPRITFQVVLIAAVGFRLAMPNGIDFVQFLHTVLGISLLSSGISALNQCWERDSDRLMRRTATRPLPTGRLTTFQAVAFSLGTTLLSIVYLAACVNPLTAFLGVLTAIGYVLCYTPLKKRTWWSTAIGSFPGAMPPLMGWTAATGDITWGAGVLFAIMFFWQFPHFLAIAWMYREEYRRAGIVMLPVIESDGKLTKLHILLTTLVLIPISFLPTLMGVAGYVYGVGAVLLGIYMLRSCLILIKTGTGLDARKLLRTSVIYLPVLFILMVFNQS